MKTHQSHNFFSSSTHFVHSKPFTSKQDEEENVNDSDDKFELFTDVVLKALQKQQEETSKRKKLEHKKHQEE